MIKILENKIHPRRAHYETIKLKASVYFNDLCGMFI